MIGVQLLASRTWKKTIVVLAEGGAGVFVHTKASAASPSLPPVFRAAQGSRMFCKAIMFPNFQFKIGLRSTSAMFVMEPSSKPPGARNRGLTCMYVYICI